MIIYDHIDVKGIETLRVRASDLNTRYIVHAWKINHRDHELAQGFNFSQLCHDEQIWISIQQFSSHPTFYNKELLLGIFNPSFNIESYPFEYANHRHEVLNTQLSYLCAQICPACYSKKAGFISVLLNIAVAAIIRRSALANQWRQRRCLQASRMLRARLRMDASRGLGSIRMASSRLPQHGCDSVSCRAIAGACW